MPERKPITPPQNLARALAADLGTGRRFEARDLWRGLRLAPQNLPNVCEAIDFAGRIRRYRPRSWKWHRSISRRELSALLRAAAADPTCPLVRLPTRPATFKIPASG
jgi:hypothetical protein